MNTKAVMMLVMLVAGIGIANTDETLIEVNLPSTPLDSGSGLVLWNRLGSTNEVNNSEIGPDGTLNAGRFVDGPFGKAIELNMQEQMGVTFPPQIVPAYAGCIEFWAKLSGFPEAIRQPGGAWPLLVGTSVLNFGIAFCSNNGAASGGIVQGVPGLGTSGTGLYGYWTYASALKTNTVNNWHHYALVWSGAGIPGVDNGQRRVISYIDGRMNTGHWLGTDGTQFTGLTNVIFGLLAHQGVPTGSVAYDNIKIWNFAKTDFSDRFNEASGDLKAKKLFLWGNNALGQCTIPADITNVAAVATAGWHTLALKSDGAVVAWGNNQNGQCNIPSDLGTGVKAIGGGGKHSLAIKSDGTVRAWGYNVNGQCNVPAGLSGVIAVDADSFHTIALKNDGTVAVWGSNFYGERNVPVGLSNVTQISAGHCFNIVRKSDGTVVAWGLNTSGQCNVPPGLSGVKSVAAGGSHSLALKEDGTVVVWGDNNSGQCNIPAGLTDVTAIAAGWPYNVALKSNGTIVMWGNNEDNKCVVPSGLANAVYIAAGEQFTAALVDNALPPPATLTVSFDSQGGSSVDSKMCIENTLYGVLPIPTRDGYTFNGWFKDAAYTLPASADMSVGAESHVLYAKWIVSPTLSRGLLLWNKLGSTNEVNNSEIGPNGTLNAGRFVDGPFGKAIELNMQEQMGVTFPPQIVPGPDGCIEFWARLRDLPAAIRQPGGSWPGLIAACSQTGSQDFMLFYCSNDGAANGGICARVAGLGCAGTGMFGSWTYASALKTNAVNDWHHYALVWASAGIPGVDNGQRKAAVYVNGKLNSGFWGGGTGSQLAIPTNGLFGLLSHQGTPAGSVAFDNIKIWNFAKTNFSDRFNEDAGDLEAKKVFVWGNNSLGQCTIPSNMTNVAVLAAAGWHNLAIKTDGTVVAWGNNQNGQCNIPSDLGTGVKAIGGGGKHSLAIKSDGTVRAWGYNVNGQCNVPAGLSGVIAVDADSFHTIALKNDGTVVVWGSNFYGERNVPAGLSNVTQISAGHCFNIVRKTDGTVVAWGQNSSGQCSVPPGLSGVKGVVAGSTHSLALKDDGTIVAWGDNSQGQCNVPAGLSDVTAIAAGWYHNVALKSDGTIVMWGNNDDNRGVVPAGIGKAVFIAAGENHTAALVDTSIVPITLTVSFNSQGGSNVDNKNYDENATYGTLPLSSRTGYTFEGWFKELATATPISAADLVGSADHTLYAKWTVNIYMLSLNAGAGTVNPSTKSITFDNTYGDLPMAERPDYLFKGWWPGVNGQGSQILASSVVAIPGDHTLYAKWEKIPLLCVPGDDTPLTTRGGYDGFLYSEGDFDNTSIIEVRGTFTMSVSRRNDSVNITAKIRVQDKNLIFRSPVWTVAGPEDVSRVMMTALGGEVLDLYVGQNRIWGTLSGGSLGVEVLMVDGMRNRFADRQDVEAQAILNTFRGYYTLALPAYGALSLGVADAAPEGAGYLTITVGNQGHVNISGVLADGTKFSKASSLILFDGCGPEACVPLFVPLYAQKGWLSGLLWFDPVNRTIVTDRDLSWFLRWEKPGSGMDGFSELLEACGGFYSTLDALSSHYRFSAGANAVPYYNHGVPETVQPVFPSNINVAADGRRLVITKGVAPVLADGAYNYAASENSSMATLSFREATGVFSGSFKVYYDYIAQERFHHRAVTVQYSGVLVPRRSEVFDELSAGMGFYLVPDNNPALAPLRLKRSYPIEMEAAR